jgi:hypothetical protein
LFRANVAHELRYAGKERVMAMKIKMLKLLTEYRGHAQVTNRRPTPRPPGLFLIQLREHLTDTTAQKRKLVVVGETQAAAAKPLPIKIHHLRGTTTPMPVVIQ